MHNIKWKHNIHWFILDRLGEKSIENFQLIHANINNKIFEERNMKLMKHSVETDKLSPVGGGLNLPLDWLKTMSWYTYIRLVVSKMFTVRNVGDCSGLRIKVFHLAKYQFRNEKWCNLIDRARAFFIICQEYNFYEKVTNTRNISLITL